MKKVLAFATLVLALAVLFVSFDEDSQELSSEQKKIVERLERKGYVDIRFGKKIPSSDSSTVIQFGAIDPQGSRIDGTILLWKNEMRIYPIL